MHWPACMTRTTRFGNSLYHAAARTLKASLSIALRINASKWDASSEH
jgi:hypothetical protein